MRWLLLLALLLPGCERPVQRVDAADYDAFWLWAGVGHQRVLDDARTIYILEGEVRADGKLIKLRPATPHVDHARLWLVYRVETLSWSDNTLPRMLADLARWKAAGNRVAGLQIDFDAATNELGTYAEFLKGLRQRLPVDSELSVTGLLDWSGQGDSETLNALGSTVNEVVLQTYQGRDTIEGYEAYLHGLTRLKIPFRIGLVQNGKWNGSEDIAVNRNFRGYVIFLVNGNKKAGPGNSGPGAR